ncbi:MAG: energy transducer TonB [Novosphingobium sp.]
MAYVSSQNSTSRARTGIAVAAMQALGIYAIIASLSYVGTQRNRDIITEATFIPPQPSPPTETPTARQTDTSPRPPIADPFPRDPLPTPLPTPIPTPFGGTDTGPGTGTGTGTGTTQASPTPEPTRAIVPTKPAKPKGRPGEWVSRNDYPAQDLREGNEGTVRFRLGIGADGRVTSCTVTGSSGFPRLDAAACTKLAQRGRFEPATDETGAKMAGTWYSSVRWSIEN